MNITRITIGRLYNLGNYEHVRYDLTVDLQDGDSASVAVVGMEKILAGLKPDRVTKSKAYIDREQRIIDEAKMMPLAEFERRHGNPVGGPAEYIKRLEDSLAFSKAERAKADQKCAKARSLFDDLAGASQWKDAKLDWDQCDDL
jgi:hypothetical protein